MDRHKARGIVKWLRDRHGREKAAGMLGIDSAYVTFAERGTENYFGRPLCPHEAIKKILAFGRIINGVIQ